MNVINLGIPGSHRQHQDDQAAVDAAAWCLHDLLCRVEGLVAAAGELLECQAEGDHRVEKGSQAVITEIGLVVQEARDKLAELMAATGSEQRPNLNDFED